ncbi:restriction endonuclease subunit S, partial [Caldithrix abyssi]|uniref:restriction endonuclease subunit S n=1 Tax=Caldithrix abyssi TaxID=187145 RepID=UPI0005C7729B
MGSEWIETTIGKFCPFHYGKRLPKKERESGQVPVFGSNGIIGKHNKSLVNGPGIIIGRKGTVGSVHLSPVSFWPIDTTFYIANGKSRDIHFTYYLLQTLGFDQMNADSAVPGLNREAAHARRIRIPPLPEQRAIAQNLSRVDSEIQA